jgi:hypothetical protein
MAINFGDWAEGEMSVSRGIQAELPQGFALFFAL